MKVPISRVPFPVDFATLEVRGDYKLIMAKYSRHRKRLHRELVAFCPQIKAYCLIGFPDGL